MLIKHRKDIKCEYSQNQHLPGSSDSSRALAGPQHSPVESDLPEVFFLDYDFYQYAQSHFLPIGRRSPPEAEAYVGDAEFVITQHFATTHGWMPVISRKKIFQQLADEQARHKPDFVILLYCMKLLMWWPPEHDLSMRTSARTAAYTTARLLLHEMESAGLLSIQVLQAKVLLCFYEMGHAIYPAAYISVGACARYGQALGIDQVNTTTEVLTITEAMDHEEQRRCWWAIIILDRFINLGSPKRSLSTREPHPQTLLPSKDEAWQNGKLPPDGFFTVSSPANVGMGTLARQAQAAYLLGYVYRFLAESDPFSATFTDERMQLDRTIWSLINLSYTEGQVSRMAICAQTALCYSALLALHQSPSIPADPEYFAQVTNILQPVAAESQWSAEMFQLGAAGPLASLSPMLSHWAYEAAFFGLRLSRDKGAEGYAAFRTMQLKLTFLRRRWLAAAVYLRILDAKGDVM